MAFMRIMVLLWADLLAWFSIWTMTTYLTDVWKLGITQATAIVNIWFGIAFTLQSIFCYLVDTLLGHSIMVFFSSIAYCIGLGLLAMSTPPVLSNSTGTCSDYKPECIGYTQKVLFYTALPLIAVGLSGHMVSLVPFIVEQNEETNVEIKMSRFQAVGLVAVIIVPVVSVFALPYIKPWSVRFGIPAICTLAATLVFLSSLCSYKYKGPQGSPLTDVFRVIKASAFKIMWKLPNNPNELYERDDPDLKYLTHTHGLRCLDKAAIKLPTNQENNRWKLCSVTEVEITKITIRVLPLWITFIMCGVVSSLGNTYFQEQANRMNPKVGKWKVPLQVFQLIYEMGKENLFDGMYRTLINYLTRLRSKRYAPVVGIAVAMIFAILCCITAAKVEARRLHAVRTHDLIDKPEERVPISMFWLVPQYLLLAGLDSFMINSVATLFSDRIPPSLEIFFIHFYTGIYGLGCFSSVLSVFTIGKISERRGNSNWFQQTLNQSRLDNYYWSLAALSAGNLFLFILAGIVYPYKYSAEDDEPPVIRRAPGEYYEEVSSCCCFETRVVHNDPNLMMMYGL